MMLGISDEAIVLVLGLFKSVFIYDFNLSISSFKSAIIFLYALICRCTIFLFGSTLIFIFFALFAYFSVLIVSSYCELPGLIVAIMTVLQLPPSESLSNLVNLLSRNGTKKPFFVLSPNALMQFARARREVLIFAPSRRRRPLFSVTVPRSEPARSMRLSLPHQTSFSATWILSWDEREI